MENPDNCGYGVTFAKELKKQIEIRFPDKGTDRVQRRMANYLSPKFKGAHLDKYGKMESTKQEIEDKVKTYEDIPEEVDTENTVNDASLSPNSKLVKNHMEKMQRERTRVCVVNNKIRTEMETYEKYSTYSTLVEATRGSSSFASLSSQEDPLYSGLIRQVRASI